MMFAEEESPIRLVPTEIIFEIMELLPLPEKKISRLVCQHWRWILDDPHFGRLSFRAVIDSNAQFLLNSCLSIANVRIGNITKWPSMTYSRNKFPQIEKATLGWNNSAKAAITFLKYGCINVQSLKIIENSFANVGASKIASLAPQLRWQYLVNLDLSVKISYWESKQFMSSIKKHMASVEFFLKLAIAPKLTRLTLCFADSRYRRNFDEEIVNLYTKLYGFLDRHTNSLKILELRLFLNQEMEFSGSLSATKTSSEIEESLRHNLKLERLIIRVSHFGSLAALVPTCLWEQDKLQLLTWEHSLWTLNGFFFIQDGGMRTAIRTIIEKNEKTLSSLNLVSRSRNATFFEIGWIKNCGSLKTLSLRGFDGIWNTQISLPTISYFEVWPFHILPLNFDTWIVQNLKGVEIVKILSKSLLFAGRGEVWKMDVPIVRNLLTLPKIREIRYASVGYMTYHYDNQIEQFCLTTPNLRYSTTECALHGILDAAEKIIRRVSARGTTRKLH